MRVIQALPGMPAQVTSAEVEEFLKSKLNLQLGTIDDNGNPSIQPVWFYYDGSSGKMYSGTQKGTLKVRNIRNNPDKIYFSIDDEAFPPKGVKGLASARISEDIKSNVAMLEKLNLKYLGTLDHPLAKMLLENGRTGNEVIIELTPKYFSAWDFGKARM
ncbi:MAG: pyridoxamine 5'-phosphate oxidase family protein [Nitrososphaera sp.]|jgi:general stress protein 26